MFKLKTAAFAVCTALGIAGCAALSSVTERTVVQPPVSALETDYLAGRRHQAAQRYGEATAAFRKALASEPSHADTHNALGAVHAAQGRYAEAITAFEAARALAPNLAYVHGNLGYAYMLSGDNDRAVRALEEAQRLDPGDQTVMSYLLLAYNRVLAQARTEVKRLEAQQARGAEVSASAPVRSPDAIGAARETVSETAALVRLEPQIYELKARSSVPAARAIPVARSATLPAITAQPGSNPIVAVAAATPGMQAPGVKAYGIEVANGNGVTGMARAVSGELVERGFSKGVLTNQLPFREPATVVQYRQGYESEATRISRALRAGSTGAPVVAHSDSLRSGVHLRVLLGRDAIRVASASEGKRKAKGSGELFAHAVTPTGR